MKDESRKPPAFVDGTHGASLPTNQRVPAWSKPSTKTYLPQLGPQHVQAESR